MKKPSKKLIELVKQEAANLRKFATKKELHNLNKEDLNADSKRTCIYGLITGHCNSERSIQLIKLCCEKVLLVSTDPSIVSVFKKNKISKHIPEIDVKSDRLIKYVSPIEKFIVLSANREDNNNNILIEYLKGEREDLDFNY